MIIKSYEINKINLEKNPFVLLYGKNEGLKKETKNTLLKNKIITANYEEKEILDDPTSFLESIFSKSLFESEKILIIKRASDKILKILSEIIDKNLKDIFIIFESDNLDKKSKLRVFFEKEKICVCVPFYPDNEQTLTKIGFDFIKEKKISISSSDLNLIINKSNGDRYVLFLELEKIAQYSKGGKKINSNVLNKLTNLIENHDISELIDYCLAQDKKKVTNILQENNLSNEDCILIVRTFLIKLKRILILSDQYKINNNINLTISSAKPPIFWKHKEITKQQILKLSPRKIRNTIYKLNDLEINIKKNYENSINLVTDFILNFFPKKTNN